MTKHIVHENSSASPTFCSWKYQQVTYKRTTQIKSERSQTLDPADTLRARLGREGDLGSRNVWVAVQILN